MYTHTYTCKTLFGDGTRSTVDYQLVRKNVAETEESISYKREEEKIWDSTNSGTGFVSLRNYIKWGRRKRQQVTPKHRQVATRLNGASAQKRILFEADLHEYSNNN